MVEDENKQINPANITSIEFPGTDIKFVPLSSNSIKEYSSKEIKKSKDILELVKAKILRHRIDTALRYILTIAILLISGMWLYRIAHILEKQATLEQSVLITLLGTTTANVLGLVYLVTTGLFKNKYKDSNRNNLKPFKNKKAHQSNN